MLCHAQKGYVDYLDWGTEMYRWYDVRTTLPDVTYQILMAKKSNSTCQRCKMGVAFAPGGRLCNGKMGGGGLQWRLVVKEVGREGGGECIVMEFRCPNN